MSVSRHSEMPATAGELARLVRSREVDPRDIVRAVLLRIQERDPQIGAFQRVRPEQALNEAERLASRSDLERLPLAGVPVAIKDNLPVEGEPLRMGSVATSDAPSHADHETVASLRRAGAIVIGLTRVPELCVWPATDGAFGVTRNPWDRSRIVGGSSGGSAAAVAAGMVPLALGADGLGSIRIPCACCGVFGFKPGPGLVPSHLGNGSWFGMAENGPIASTVDDAALMLSVLADRADLRDIGAAPRLRIALATRPAIPVKVDREFVAATEDFGALLAGAGHEVTAADPPRPALRHVTAIFAHWFAGAAADAEGLVLDRLEPRTRRHVRFGRGALRLGLVRSRDRESWAERNLSFFQDFDLLLTPSLASIPPAILDWSRRSWSANVWFGVRFAPFAGGWNFAGFPAAAVPAGVHSSGMPLSIQIVGRPGSEARILAVAREIETLRPWKRFAGQ